MQPIAVLLFNLHYPLYNEMQKFEFPWNGKFTTPSIGWLEIRLGHFFLNLSYPSLKFHLVLTLYITSVSGPTMLFHSSSHLVTLITCEVKFLTMTTYVNKVLVLTVHRWCVIEFNLLSAWLTINSNGILEDTLGQPYSYST